MITRDLKSLVNPARAGMILQRLTAIAVGLSKPRASGDDPYGLDIIVEWAE